MEEKIIFIARKCPRCGELLAVRKLGVWGYYCISCAFWWGTYKPYPQLQMSK